MRVDLSNLRALVTGSTKGIGRAIALKLAANGAEVVVNGRKPNDVADVIEGIRKEVSAAKLVAAPGDCATAAGVAAVIKAAGDVDLLVNNVGIFEVKDAFTIPDEDWTRQPVDTFGLRYNGKLLRWRELKELSVAQGRLCLKQTGKWMPWALVDVGGVPNLHVLFALADEAQLRPPPRREPKPPPAKQQWEEDGW